MKLTEKQQTKLRALHSLRVALDGLLEADRGARDAALATVSSLERRRGILTTSAGPPMRTPTVEVADKLAELEQQIAEARKPLESLGAQMARYLEPFDAARAIVNAVSAHARLADDALGVVPLPPLRLLDAGAKERARLDGVREQIDALDEQIDTIREAPLPIDEAVAKFQRSLADALSVARVQLQYSRDPVSVSKPPELTLGLAALLLPAGEVERRVRAYFERLDLPAGMPSDARAPAIEKLVRKRTSLLEDEERETCALEARGLVVVRRRDVPPDLLLRVWDALP